MFDTGIAFHRNGKERLHSQKSVSSGSHVIQLQSHDEETDLKGSGDGHDEGFVCDL